MSLHNNHFYNSTTRRFVVSFGNLLNNIHIVRYGQDGKEDNRERVPMAYGPKEKYLYLTEQNPDINTRFAIKLPRISYELVEVRYDSTRKTPANHKIQNAASAGKRAWSYNAVPYQFLFSVYIMGKTSDECLQIVEQIAPFFTPDYTMTVNISPELDHKLDIPITLDTIALEDNWDSQFSERRSIVWNMNFTLNGFLYPPVRESKIILEADWNIDGYDDGNGIEHYSSGIETTQVGIF